jgi:1-acyl-sn-glycerol-3-phosphate acyltransferase
MTDSGQVPVEGAAAMTDAKVIPFGDDSRRRGGGSGSARARARGRKPAGSAGSAGSAAKAETGGQAPLAAVPEEPREEDGGDGAANIPAQADGARAAAEPQDGPEGAAGSAGAGAEAGAGAGGGPGTASGAKGPVEPVTPSLTAALSGVADRVLGGPWERKVAAGLAFLRRRVTGEYEVDEFGYDAELTDQVLISLVRPLYESYFRVEVKGIENIPSEGGALVVSNHSGTLPIDALMTQVAVHDQHPAGRHLRLLAADLVFMLPLVNDLARKAGHTLACTEDAQLLLERGEVVGVMPEGFKGLGKPFSERYKLQRFGRGGFVATALKTKVPIIPCSVVGAEEIYPMVGNSRTLARVLGFPYFPLTPTFPWLGPLGLIPLPTKWTIQFGEPIPTDGYPPEAAEDPMLVFNLTDQVRETIQHTLYEVLVDRRSVFF